MGVKVEMIGLQRSTEFQMRVLEFGRTQDAQGYAVMQGNAGLAVFRATLFQRCSDVQWDSSQHMIVCKCSVIKCINLLCIAEQINRSFNRLTDREPFAHS